MKTTHINPNDAVLHDAQHAWAGTLEKITDYGCEIRVKADEETVGPHAQRNARLLLQVLTENEASAEELSVELDGIRRIGDEWVYRLTWAA